MSWELDLVNHQVEGAKIWLDRNVYWTFATQFSSVTQSCLTLCDPMNHSTPGLPVHHQLPEFTQTHLQLRSYKTVANPPVITMARITIAIIKNVPIRLKSFTHNTFSSVTWSCLTLYDSTDCSTLFITNCQSFLKLMSIESVMPSNHLILCRPLLLLPSIFPSIRVFSNESVLHIRWTKYWSFSFSISPSNEYSGLISFRMDWLDFLAVQGTLKSLLQHHRSEASILWH